MMDKKMVASKLELQHCLNKPCCFGGILEKASAKMQIIANSYNMKMSQGNGKYQKFCYNAENTKTTRKGMRSIKLKFWTSRSFVC